MNALNSLENAKSLAALKIITVTDRHTAQGQAVMEGNTQMKQAKPRLTVQPCKAAYSFAAPWPASFIVLGKSRV